MKKAVHDIREIIASLPHTANSQTGEDYAQADWVQAENGYPFYVKVAEIVQPDRFLEVGSFLGFGLVAFHTGHPKAALYSVDNESYLPNSRALSEENVRAVKGRIHTYTTISDLPFTDCEGAIIHVDGDHSFAGALHDLVQCWAMRPRVMLVDDYRFLGEVKEAVEFFAARNNLPFKVWESYRGWAVFAQPDVFATLPNSL